MPRRRNLHDGRTQRMLAECRHCGQVYVIADGSVPAVCPECIEAHYTECPECGRMVYEREGVRTTSGRTLCPSCAAACGYRCGACGEFHERADRPGTLAHGGSEVCPECLRDYDLCDDCGRWFPSEDVEECGDEHVCWSCMAGRADSGRVLSYSYKPVPVFHRVPGEARDSLVLGIELEMDGGDCDQAVARIASRYGHEWLYFKHDSSLRSGAELVTHPISPAVLLSDEGRAMWSEVCRAASAAGMKSHDTDTCGLHIHVNRDFFGTSEAARLLAEYKLCALADRFYEPLVIFSRRKRDRMEQWARRPELPTCDGGWMAKAKAARAAGKYDRYRAVNIRNSHTIEFRMFRGTLKPETLLATFAFVAGVCEYAKQATPGQVERITWYDLCDEALARCPQGVRELEEYLVNKELIAKGA